jgi:hypothetical protein
MIVDPGALLPLIILFLAVIVAGIMAIIATCLVVRLGNETAEATKRLWDKIEEVEEMKAGALKQEVAINELKRQIVMMELDQNDQ